MLGFALFSRFFVCLFVCFVFSCCFLSFFERFFFFGGGGGREQKAMCLI